MKNLLKKISDNSVITYVFFGVCTTLVNLIIYYGLRFIIPTENIVTLGVINVFAIVCSIVFAYFTNSKFVFKSEVRGFKGRSIEFAKFFGARMFTLVLEAAGVPFLLWLGVNDWIGKLIVQVIVFVLNYIFSKFLVFIKKDKQVSGKHIREISDEEEII